MITIKNDSVEMSAKNVENGVGESREKNLRLLPLVYGPIPYS